MSSTLRRLRACAALLPLLAGCGGGSTPSTPAAVPTDVVVVESQQLVSTSDNFCHVQGTVRNLSTDRQTLTLRWAAFDAANKVIANTATVVTVSGGGTEAFDATAFFDSDKGVVPCSRISRFERIFDAV